jgi:hypothetical protein
VKLAEALPGPVPGVLFSCPTVAICERHIMWITPNA